MCNGKWDCPYGLDEIPNQNCTSDKCQFLCKCVGSHICVHLGQFGDGISDCPSGDDEYIQELNFITCPKWCICVTFVMRCVDGMIDLNMYKIAFYYIMIIRKSTFHASKFKWKDLVFFTVTYTNLINICEITSILSHLRILHATFNLIEEIVYDCFSVKNKISVIRLNDNRLEYINAQTIPHLKYLKLLNITNNFISVLFHELFSSDIDVLSVKNNWALVLSENILDSIKVKFIETDDYRICCKTNSTHVCNSLKLWFQSCSDLLPTKVFKFAWFNLFLLVVFCITFCLLFQMTSMIKSSEQRSFRVLAKLLRINDFSLVVYMLTLYCADFVYASNFIFVQDQWKSSLLCQSIYFSFLSYSILSPSLLFTYIEI